MIAASLLLAADPQSVAAAGPRGVAEVVGAPPGVEMRSSPASPWVPVAADARLAAGATVRTAQTGVNLRMADGSTLSLSPSTTLRLHVPTQISMDPGTDTRVSRCDLLGGEVSLSIPSKSSPVLVMAGTDLFAAFRPGRARAVKSDQGLVAIVDEGGARVASSGRWFSLAAGQYQVLPERGPVAPVRQVGPVPSFSTRPCIAEGGRGCAIGVVVGDGTTRLGASWAPAAPGIRFLVKIARDRGFLDLIEEREVGPTQTTFLSAPLKEAQYWLEVRSVTADGVRSEAAVRPLRVVRVVPETGVIHVPSSNTFVLPPGRGVLVANPTDLVISFGGRHAGPAPSLLGLTGSLPRRSILLGTKDAPDDFAPVTLEARALAANVEFEPRNPRWPADQVQISVRLVDPNRRVNPNTVQPRLKVSVNGTVVPLPVERAGKVWRAALPSRSGDGPWVVRVEVLDNDGFLLGRGVLGVVGEADRGAR